MSQNGASKSSVFRQRHLSKLPFLLPPFRNGSVQSLYRQSQITNQIKLEICQIKSHCIKCVSAHYTNPLCVNCVLCYDPPLRRHSFTLASWSHLPITKCNQFKPNASLGEQFHASDASWSLFFKANSAHRIIWNFCWGRGEGGVNVIFPTSLLGTLNSLVAALWSMIYDIVQL